MYKRNAYFSYLYSHVAQLYEVAQPSVLFLDRLDAQPGRDFWHNFQAVSSNLRCLELTVLQNSHHDHVD